MLQLFEFFLGILYSNLVYSFVPGVRFRSSRGHIITSAVFVFILPKALNHQHMCKGIIQFVSGFVLDDLAKGHGARLFSSGSADDGYGHKLTPEGSV